MNGTVENCLREKKQQHGNGQSWCICATTALTAMFQW